MEHKSPSILANPFQNLSYALLYDTPGLDYYQLSVAVFFTPGYSIDQNVQPTVTQDPGQPTQFNANFNIINNGGQTNFGVVNFNYQFSSDPAIFTIANIILTDSTTAQVSTTKIHHDDVNVGADI